MRSNFQSRLPGYTVIETDEPYPSSLTVTRHANRDRRNRCQPVPFNLSTYLNDEQTLSLRHLESFGWQLAFVRRQLFRRPTVVVLNCNDNRYGVLDESGSIDMDRRLSLRH